MKTKFETLEPQQQDAIRSSVEKAVAENGFSEAQKADLEYLLGMRPDLPPKRS